MKDDERRTSEMATSQNMLKTTGSFQRIPIIDVENARHPDVEIRKALAREIRDACIHVGFFYVKNHGISEHTLEKIIPAAERFFSLPVEVKLKVKANPPDYRGYTGFMAQNVDRANKGDMHESFNVGPNEPDAPADRVLSETRVNRWLPEKETPGFREVVQENFQSAVNFGQTMYPLFALALDLPETFFDEKIKEAAVGMRIMHYPPQAGPVDDRIHGIGAHSDFQCFTILWQEPGVQALQVLNAENQWIEAPPIDSTLVVNLGGQLSRWTNDVFKATLHRVINRTGLRRISIPYFFGTDDSVPLEPIPSCVSAERPQMYEVISSGDYYSMRLQAVYGSS